MSDSFMTRSGVGGKDDFISDEYDLIPKVAKKRSNIRDAIKQDYQCPDNLSRPDLCRHFFAWTAKNYPGISVSYSHVYVAIHGRGYTKTPAANSRQVRLLAASASSIRHSLAKWGMFLISDGAGGARATFDPTDAVKTEMVKRAIDHSRTGKRLRASFDIIKPHAHEITDPTYRAWFTTNVQKIVRALPGVEKKLTVPLLEDKNKNKNKK